MNEFMKVLLSLSISGTLLLLLLLGLKRLYQNKFSRHWQYYIWIIVAFRFLLPFTPDATIVGGLFEKLNTTIITDNPSVNPNLSVTGNEGNWESEQAQANKNTGAVAAMHNPRNISAFLFLVWAALVSILFIRKITLYQNFTQYMKAFNTKAADDKMLSLLSDCKENMNIKAKVELYHNAMIASPMMIGFVHPSIVLPDREMRKSYLIFLCMS